MQQADGGNETALEQKKQKRRKGMIALFFAVILLIVLIMLLTLSMFAARAEGKGEQNTGKITAPENGGDKSSDLPENSENEQAQPPEDKNEDASYLPTDPPVGNEQDNSEDSEQLLPPEEPPAVDPEPETPPQNQPETETPPANSPCAVGETDAVPRSYFDDAVFIGDSRTEGMLLSTGLSNAISYTHKGLMVDTVFTAPVIHINGDKVSVMDALRQTSFSKVYIMLGVNETGWPYSSVFIDRYAKIIDAVKQINPDAVIYVQSVLPVSNEVSSTHEYLKNGKIDEYNRLILKMAEEKQIYYVNVAEAVSAADGSLPEDAATDGIHLKKTYCELWLSYLESHTVSAE